MDNNQLPVSGNIPSALSTENCSNMMANTEGPASCSAVRSEIMATLTPKKIGSLTPVGTPKSLSILADTGASICVGSKAQLEELGLTWADLSECSKPIDGVGGIRIVCKHFILIEFKVDAYTTTQEVYFYDGDARYILLSHKGCEDLNMIHHSFPSPMKRKGKHTSELFFITVCCRTNGQFLFQLCPFSCLYKSRH